MVAVFHIGSIVIGHGALLVHIRSSRLYRYSHGSLFSGQEVWCMDRGVVSRTTELLQTLPRIIELSQYLENTSHHN